MREYVVSELYSGFDGMRCEFEDGCTRRSRTIYLTDNEDKLIREELIREELIHKLIHKRYRGYSEAVIQIIFGQRSGLVLCKEHSYVAEDEEELKRQITVHQKVKAE